MTLLSVEVSESRLTRVNPLAKIAALVLVSVALILTLDPVSAGTVLLIESILLAAFGLGRELFSPATLPAWFAAPVSGIVMTLYGRASGDVIWAFGPVLISEGSILIGLSTALRILALALPAIVLFRTVDSTDLADSLAQLLHLPARFVLGALAGMRLATLFVDDWRTMERARRARGVADRGAVRRWGGLAFALLVLSVRRGSALATAMEARGFGAPGRRTWSRRARFRGRDVLFSAGGAVLGALGVLTAVVAGTWSPVFAG